MTRYRETPVSVSGQCGCATRQLGAWVPQMGFPVLGSRDALGPVGMVPRDAAQPSSVMPRAVGPEPSQSTAMAGCAYVSVLSTPRHAQKKKRAVAQSELGEEYRPVRQSICTYPLVLARIWLQHRPSDFWSSSSSPTSHHAAALTSLSSTARRDAPHCLAAYATHAASGPDHRSQ